MSIQLFVPGRVCLLGEHTDWAGGYGTGHRGQCLVYGTDVGIHATAMADVSSAAPMLRYLTTAHDGTHESFEATLDVEVLKRVAAEGGFFSYICGTAAVVLARLAPSAAPLPTIIIDNHTTTMPMKKGLSSSAAVCTAA